jgi:hypothetical protein
MPPVPGLSKSTSQVLLPEGVIAERLSSRMAKVAAASFRAILGGRMRGEEAGGSKL